MVLSTLCEVRATLQQPSHLIFPASFHAHHIFSQSHGNISLFCLSCRHWTRHRAGKTSVNEVYMLLQAALPFTANSFKPL